MTSELVAIRDLADAVLDEYEPSYPMLWEDAARNLSDREAEVSGMSDSVIDAVKQLSGARELPSPSFIDAARDSVDSLATVLVPAERDEQLLVSRAYAVLAVAEKFSSGETITALLDLCTTDSGTSGRSPSRGLSSDRVHPVGTAPSTADDPALQDEPGWRSPRPWDHLAFGAGLLWIVVVFAMIAVISFYGYLEVQDGAAELSEIMWFAAVAVVLNSVGLAIVIGWYRSRLR